MPGDVVGGGSGDCLTGGEPRIVIGKRTRFTPEIVVTALGKRHDGPLTLRAETRVRSAQRSAAQRADETLNFARMFLPVKECHE